MLGNLKTTVEGLVSINNPNVWSKYGGLERLCRDMHSILYHGLIPDKVGFFSAFSGVYTLTAALAGGYHDRCFPGTAIKWIP